MDTRSQQLLFRSLFLYASPFLFIFLYLTATVFSQETKRVSVAVSFSDSSARKAFADAFVSSPYIEKTGIAFDVINADTLRPDEVKERLISGAFTLTIQSLNSMLSNEDRGTMPFVQLIDQPGLFSSARQQSSLLDGELGDLISNELSKSGLQVIEAYSETPQALIARTRISAASELSGLKVLASAKDTNVFAAVGASPVQLPFGETYVALQTGAIDAVQVVVEADSDILQAAEGGTFVDNFRQRVGVLLCATDQWLNLSENQRSAILLAASDASIKASEKIDANHNALVATADKLDIHLLDFTESDRSFIQNELPKIWIQNEEQTSLISKTIYFILSEIRPPTTINAEAQ